MAYNHGSQITGDLAGMSKADNVVTFTNMGTTPCRTAGYPGVAALNTAGGQIMQAVRQAGSAPVIVLAPGQSASALISADTASCDALTTVAGLLVTAPNQTTSTRLGPAGQFCLKSLRVAPLQPGATAGINP
ncbi:MAG: DUF4232 domain-containing protein [Streptosporangiaceae bacterium]